MATKRKSKTLKLQDSADQQRDDVEFIVDGEVVAFRLKLPDELGLEDLEEYIRLRRQMEQSESLEDDDERLDMILRVLRRLIKVLFYDPIPDTVLGTVNPERLFEIGDFLEERWTLSTSMKAKAKAKATAVKRGQRVPQLTR